MESVQHVYKIQYVYLLKKYKKWGVLRVAAWFLKVNTATVSTPVILYIYPRMKMEQSGCSETLAYKLQTPVNHREESIQHSEHG
jgi:hypothetical protein